MNENGIQVTAFSNKESSAPGSGVNLGKLTLKDYIRMGDAAKLLNVTGATLKKTIAAGNPYGLIESGGAYYMPKKVLQSYLIALGGDVDRIPLPVLETERRNIQISAIPAWWKKVDAAIAEHGYKSRVEFAKVAIDCFLILDCEKPLKETQL